MDAEQHEEVTASVGDMLRNAQDACIPKEHGDRLKNVVLEHQDIFRIAFSDASPVIIKQLNIDLNTDGRTIRLKLHNYSKEQRDFLSKFPENLIRCGMANLNPTSSWALAPLLVHKPGPSKILFTFDLRLVNKFMLKHQYSIPNLYNELTKLHKVSCIATFDKSHGYW